MKVDRRDFLKIIGVGTAGTAVSGCSFEGLGTALQLTQKETYPEPGPESWVASTCGQCSGGCGILVRKIGERAVKIEGNPANPINRGGLCPLGQASLQLLYNPDRIRQPLKRKGARGEGQWEPIGWEEAVAVVAGKLAELRKKGAPHKLAVVSGNERGLTSRLFKRFLEAYGSPNFIYAGPLDVMAVARSLMEGEGAGIYDLENATHILSFGLELLDGWWSPVRQMRAYAHLRQGRPGRRGRLIQVESRLSVTAAKADEWIAVRPGTEGVLALGLAHVMIREELYNKEFVQRFTSGFEDRVDEKGVWRPGFKSVVMEEHTPDRVSALTGVGVDRIFKLARDFASAEKPLALCGAYTSNATFSATAVHALNALVGNIGARGGVYSKVEVSPRPWPAAGIDGMARKGLAAPKVEFRAEGLLNDKPYPLEVLFVYKANPLFFSLGRKRLSEALQRVPLIVSFASLLDETALFSDLILPDHTYLESWDDEPGPPGLPFAYMGLRRPVVNPLYQTRHTGDLVMGFARALGGDIERAFPWKDFKQCLLDEFRGIYELGVGTIGEGELEASWVKFLEERGWRRPVAGSFEEFWEKLQARGSWWDPAPDLVGQRFKTSSGKFEFAASGTNRLGTFPAYEKPKILGDEKSFPFVLYLYTPLALLDETGANQPFLQEIVGPHVNMHWGSWVEIHPKTAARLGIEDGAWVFVESPSGKVRTRAKLYGGAMADVASIPLGQGHTALGRWAKGKGVNPLDLIGEEYDSASGLPALVSVRVKVYKA